MSKHDWEQHIRSLGLDADINVAYHHHRQQHPRCRVCGERRRSVRRNIRAEWRRAASGHAWEVRA